MKHHIKIQLLMCSLFIALLSAVPFSSYAESSGLNEQEFARVCEDNHAVQTRSLHPPLKNPAADTFNYEFHYREILLSPDGKGFIDNTHDMSRYRNLAGGQILMDMADGYEISYEYHIKDFTSDDADVTVIEGGKITPYYRAVPLSTASGSGKQCTYISNEPEEPPIIPDFPKDYDWKSHGGTTLEVYPLVTVRSLMDGSTYTYTSRVSYVTNLYKSKPDCYFLTPTDLEAYTIRKGDSLQKIAGHYYADSDDWIYILERNQDRIKNADMICPGTLIVIPNAEAKK